MPPDPTLNYTRPFPSERRAAFARAARRWFRRSILSIFVLAPLFFAIDQTWVWYWRRIQVGHDTTRITSPIEPSGCPDYLAALNAQYSAGVTPQNNAAPLLLEITGTNDSPPTWRSAIQKLLALGPAPLPRQLVTLAESKHVASGSTTKPTLAEQSAAEDEEDQATKSPWNLVDHPQWAAWIKANTRALALLQTATIRARYYIPIVSQAGAIAHLNDETLLSLQIPPFALFRQLGRIALARAMMRLDARDFDGFREDALTTARFARLLSQSPTLPGYLVALAIDQKASATLQAAAASEKLDASHVDSLLHHFAALPPFPPPTTQCDGYERFMCLDATCKVARFAATKASFVDSTLTGPINFNHCLRLTNSYFDSMLAALAQPTFAQRQREFAANGRRVDLALKHSGRIERMILSVTLPDFSKAEALHTAALANRNLALTALALRADKLRSGAFPERLSDLGSPPTTQSSVLSTQPFLTDPFTDHPLVYRQADGYLLYSLGPNQKDDGGTPRAPEGPARTSYDIAVRATK